MANSFTSHFIELRSRLVKSVVFILIIFIISYTFADHIYNFLVEPYADAVKNDQTSRRMIFTALHETFITYLKVSLNFILSLIRMPEVRYSHSNRDDEQFFKQPRLFQKQIIH
mgnify:CR=1 FL=1